MSFIPNKSLSPLALRSTTVTILAGQSQSTVGELAGDSLLAIQFPIGLTSSTFTFNASADGVNFSPLTDAYSGNPIQIMAASNNYGRVLPSDFAGISAIQLNSLTPQVDTVQILLITGPVL